MLLTDYPDLRLQYDAPLGLLRLRWAGGPRMERFREAAAYLLDITQKITVTHCLVEMDALPDISPYDQIWLGISWLPKVLQLPLQRVVFVIGSHRVYHQLTIDSLMAKAQPFIRFEVQFFGLVRPVLHFLTDDSPRLPALLAEWEVAYSSASSAPPSVAESLARYRRLPPAA